MCIGLILKINHSLLVQQLCLVVTKLEGERSCLDAQLRQAKVGLVRIVATSRTMSYFIICWS